MPNVRKIEQERGAAAVEFAIVLPLLFAIIIGIVEISLIMFDKTQITTAGRNGARLGTMWRPTSRPTCDEINTSAVQGFRTNLIYFGNPAAKTITTTCFSDGAAVAGATPICTQDGHEALLVRTRFTYRFLVDPIRLLNLLTGGHSTLATLTLTSETIMRCE